MTRRQSGCDGCKWIEADRIGDRNADSACIRSGTSVVVEVEVEVETAVVPEPFRLSGFSCAAIVITSGARRRELLLPDNENPVAAA